MRLVLDDEPELQKRIRAARGYRGWSHAELGKELGLSESTIKRLARALPAGKKRQTYIEQVAAKCGLPFQFFTVDFNDLSLLDTMRSLEDLDEDEEVVISAGDLAATNRRLEELEEAVRKLSATRPEVARLPPLGDELRRRVEGAPPDPRDRRPGENQPEDNSQTGTGG